jgi:hypothetical protein
MDDGDHCHFVPDVLIADIECEQYFRVNAVLILLAQPLLGRAATRRGVIIHDCRIKSLRRFAAVKARSAIHHSLAFQLEAVVAVCQLDPSRGSLPVLLRNSVYPLLGR